MLNNPRLIALGIALILVAGLAALASLPRLEDPYFGNRDGIVLTQFPGASAERIETLVIEPLESELRSIPEIKHINSTAKSGVAAISIVFVDEVPASETDRLWSEVRDKLEKAAKSLPAGASPPQLDHERSYAFTWIGALRWQGEDADLLTAGRYAEELASRLRNLHGTDLVKLWGAPDEEVQVKVDVIKAASVGLDVNSIASKLQNSDAKSAAGELVNGEFRLPVELAGGFEQLERIRRTPLLTLDEGGSLQVQDLAEIYLGEPVTPKDLALVSGERAIVVAVRMLPDQRGDLWAARLREKIAEFSASLPAEIEVEELFSQEGYTSARLSELIVNIGTGFLLIFIILLFTLGWRSAVIVAVSLPMTMLFALGCMRFNHMPIHQMSVTGLIVALGIMVDNAIVMSDMVMRYRRQGFSPVASATKAFRHLWLPLLGSTLTTMLAFMPIVLMPGPGGEFIGPLAESVIFALAGSWIISLFIIAPIAGRWLSGEKGASSALAGRRLGPWLNIHYRCFLAAVLERPRMSAMLCFALPLSGFMLAQTLTEQFFPPSDRDMINLEVYLPAGSSIFDTQRATERMSEVINSHQEIESLHWFVGRSAPPFYYNIFDNMDGAPFYAQAMTTVRSVPDANRMVSVLQRELDERFPEYQTVVRRLGQGPPTPAPVELRLYGSEIDRLVVLGDELRRIALETEHVVQARTSLGETVPKLVVNIEESEAQRSQVGLRDIAGSLAASVDGVVTSSLLDGSEQLPVRVSGDAVKGTSVDRFMSFPLVLPTGPRPLSAIADAHLEPIQAKITRRDGRRINKLEVYIQDGVMSATVLDALLKNIEKAGFAVPAGYELEVGGEAENRSTTVGKLMGSAGIVAVLLVVTVVMAFNSFRLSAIVFMVAGQSAGLGMLSLWLANFPFGFTAIVGLMGLMGLAVNAAIVILTELKASPLAMAGNRADIVETVAECTRHIVSTTLTTVAGLVPLLIAKGQFWPPFAIVLAGGTVFTTILSLVFVPAMFLIMRKPYVAALVSERMARQTQDRDVDQTSTV